MMENRVHNRMKILMAVMLLLLAYFLPGICAKKTGEQRITDEQRKTAEEQKKIAYEQKKVSEKQPAKKGEEDAEENTGKNGMQDRGEQLQDSEQEENPPSGGGAVIIVDPGHGGEDPGMVGVGGVKEKEINLQVSGVLGGLLKQQGFSVIYTRSSDQGLYDADTANKKAQDMQRRCALIEEKNPVLTVSIHQNSYSDPAVCGPQVFYFEHSAKGKELASFVQEELNGQLEITRPRVMKGNTNYYILKRSAGVTILVECSFLSNPEEAKKIQTPEYQQAVAGAICSGILKYLEKEAYQSQ